MDRNSKEYWAAIDAETARVREDANRKFFAAFDQLLKDIDALHENAIKTRAIPRELWHTNMLDGTVAELQRTIDRFNRSEWETTE